MEKGGRGVGPCVIVRRSGGLWNGWACGWVLFRELWSVLVAGAFGSG